MSFCVGLQVSHSLDTKAYLFWYIRILWREMSV